MQRQLKLTECLLLLFPLGKVQSNLYTAKTPNPQFNTALNFSSPKLTCYFQGEMKDSQKRTRLFISSFGTKNGKMVDEITCNITTPRQKINMQQL